MRAIIAKNHLKADPKGKLFHDFAKAPAGNFGDAVAVARQPAGAVQFPDSNPLPPASSLAEDIYLENA